jgi:transposase
VVRGRTKKQASMLAFVDPETLIPTDHPLRTIKGFADAALIELSPLFDQMYAADGQGRASNPPERLLKASLLISLYSVRSERAFCEELTCHLLFRWFLDMDMVEPTFDHSTFSKNRARLLRHRVSREFFGAVVLQAIAGRTGRYSLPSSLRTDLAARHEDGCEHCNSRQHQPDAGYPRDEPRVHDDQDAEDDQ